VTDRAATVPVPQLMRLADQQCIDLYTDCGKTYVQISVRIFTFSRGTTNPNPAVVVAWCKSKPDPKKYYLHTGRTFGRFI